MSTVDPAHLAALIEEELPSLIAIRHDLHANPGVMYEETYASAVVQRELAAAGIDFRAGLAGGTGVVGHLPGAAPRAIGLRADMDALPIQEETSCAYKSRVPGVMHACGHDGHTTILIGAARVLKRLAATTDLPQPVAFVFQPAEEGGAGGDRMVREGCLDGSLFAPPVGQIFALHGWPELEVGRILTRVGPITAATSVFEIRVQGVGCHAAFPHAGRDPLVAAAAIITALQSIVARNVDPLAAAVVSVTQCHGGTTHNVIPGEVFLQGTIRTLDAAVDAQVKARVARIAEQVAAAYDCTATVSYVGNDYPVTYNAPAAVETLQAAVPETDTRMPPVMGGEDFAFYGQHVPAAFFALGLRRGDARMPGLHHPQFDFTDDAIRYGVDAFCRLALHGSSGQ